MAKHSSLSCAASTAYRESEESLGSNPSFDTYEEFFYYYEKQDHLKSNEFDNGGGDGGIEEGIEEDDFEIPFTNTIRLSKRKSTGERRCSGSMVDREGLEEDVDFVPPFYDSNELRPIAASACGGGGPIGEGLKGSSASKKLSRIPKKIVTLDRQSHQRYNKTLEMQQEELEPARDVAKIIGGRGKTQQYMLPRQFCMERVECFDLSRDRNEIIQYHDTQT